MIGDNIKRIRELKGISQSEFADMLKIKRQTLFKYEKNIITNIPIERIEQMATILDVDPAELMGWNQSNQKDRLIAYYESLKPLMDKVAQLDDEDRARLEERAAILLESEKYKKG